VCNLPRPPEKVKMIKKITNIFSKEKNSNNTILEFDKFTKVIKSRLIDNLENLNSVNNNEVINTLRLLINSDLDFLALKYVNLVQDKINDPHNSKDNIYSTLCRHYYWTNQSEKLKNSLLKIKDSKLREAEFKSQMQLFG
jgi:hypothetical protein